MRLRSWAPALAALGLGLAAPVRADCTVELSPVAFGVIDTTGQSRGTGEVVVRCDVAGPFSVAIAAGGSGTRRMTGPGGSRLDYRLYSDPGRSVPWGDGLSQGDPVAAASDGQNARRLTIYGAVPQQSGVAPGEYVDSLEVTLSF